MNEKTTPTTNNNISFTTKLIATTKNTPIYISYTCRWAGIPAPETKDVPRIPPSQTVLLFPRKGLQNNKNKKIKRYFQLSFALTMRQGGP